MATKYKLGSAVKLLKKVDYYLVLLSVLLITIGTSWVSDELNDLLSSSSGFNPTILLLGFVLTFTGIWFAKIIASQFVRPNPDTFKAFKGEQKQQEIKDTELVVMGLSLLTNENEALEKLQKLDWSALCSNDNHGINWQQNIRTIKTFVSNNKDVQFIVVCSDQSDSLFPEFQKLIKRLELENGLNISLEKAKESVDVNSIASCSAGIKKVLNNQTTEKVVIDITSATKQYSAACTLETTYRDKVYLGYVSNDANYYIYNVLNEERGDFIA